MLTKTHLYREIHQQPEVLARLYPQARPALTELARLIERHQVTQVVVAARGTSDNAGRYAQYLLGSMNGLLVTLATPSLFTLYQRPPQLKGTLVLGISQSGQSPDIVAVLAEARRQGAITAVITNTPQSDLAQQGDVVVDLQVGVETAVAATKSYTASLAALAHLSAILRRDEKMKAALANLPPAAATTLRIEPAIAQVAPRYRYMERCVVIGRGYNYATAFELALKLKELTYTVVEPYSSADFRHGPLALIEAGFPVIVIAPGGVMTAEMQAFMRQVGARQAEVVAISDEPDTLRLARIGLPLETAVAEWLSPITAIIPGQLLALHLAHTRDYDVDAPRAIQKVTETK
ncbi:MAG: SIS domain-containing protein [Chloroflexota bacterium]